MGTADLGSWWLLYPKRGVVRVTCQWRGVSAASRPVRIHSKIIYIFQKYCIYIVYAVLLVPANNLTNYTPTWVSACFSQFVLNLYVVSSSYVCACTLLAYATTALAFARPWSTKVLRKAYAVTKLWLRKAPPKGFAYSAMYTCCSSHVDLKNSTYANLAQQVCSTWSLRNLTQHYVQATDWYDIDAQWNVKGSFGYCSPGTSSGYFEQ